MAQELPEILTPQQVADYLQIPTEEITKLLESTDLPGFKIVGQWRIRKVQFNEWLDSQIAQSSEEEVSRTESPAKEEYSPQEIQDNFQENISSLESFKEEDIQTVDSEQDLSSDSKDSRTTTKTNSSVLERPKWNRDLLSEDDQKTIRGTITYLKEENAFGFIKTNDNKDAFFHFSDVVDAVDYLSKGDLVEFIISPAPQGKSTQWIAKKVKLLSSKQQSHASVVNNSFSQISPNNNKQQTGTLYQQALAAREREDIESARQYFEQSIRLESDPQVFLTYASTERKANRRNKAKEIFQKGLKKYPDVGILYEHYARFLRESQHLTDAVAILEKGLELAPNHAAQLHHLLAIILSDLGNDDSLKQAKIHAKEAERLGVKDLNLTKTNNEKLSLNRIDFITKFELGGKILDFLENAGLHDPRIESVNGKYTDILIKFKGDEWKESYDLKGRILLRYFKDDLEQHNINDLVSKINPRYFRLDLNDSIVFLVSSNVNSFRDSLYQILEKKNRIIIPLDINVINQMEMEDNTPEDFLRQVLDEWLSRRDLFKDNSPVSGRRFFGREKELQNLMRNIDDGNHTGIYGLRKVGKTSLLHQLKEKRPQDWVVYIDLQETLHVKDCAYLYWMIAKKFSKIIREEKDDEFLTKFIQLDLGEENDYTLIENLENNALRFDGDINKILNFLNSNQQTANPKIVITIDELEWMLPISTEHQGFKGYSDFFAYIRGISQRTQGQVVSIIAAANSSISEEGQWEGRDNPVFQFYQEMFLSPLAKIECIEMIEKLGKGMGVFFSSESLDLIYEETGGHPYITRQFCSHIIHQFPKRPLQVTPEIISNNIHKFLQDKGQIFKEILDRLDFFAEEKALFELIAEGHSDEKNLADLVNQPINIAMRHLRGYQIIDYQDQKYVIKFKLLDRWLQKYHY